METYRNYRVAKLSFGEKKGWKYFEIRNQGIWDIYYEKPIFSKELLQKNNIDIEKLKTKQYAEFSDIEKNCIMKVGMDYIVDEKKCSIVEHSFCDEKTEKYILSTLDNIGFIGMVAGYEEEIQNEGFKILEETHIQERHSRLKLEKNGKIYHSYRIFYVDIDDYTLVDYIFSSNATYEKIKVIKTVEDIYQEMEKGIWKDTFMCWECGRESHWLDNKDTKGIIQKYEVLNDQYCGC